MECVSQIVSKLMSIYSFVEPHYNYFISYESNIAKLKEEVQTLTALRTDMQRKVDDAKSKGEVILESVNNWLGRVTRIIADSNSSQTNEEGIAGSSSSQTNEEGHQEVIAGSSSSQTNEEGIAGSSSSQTNEEGHPDVIRCLNWPFACLWQRSQRSKEAEDMAQKVSAIIADGRLLQATDISSPAPPQMTASSSARGYKVMESRTSLLNDIKQALKDPYIYKIGVHGMSGTGKTTLVKELAWQVEQEGSSFGKVVMATITNTPNLRRIQGQLADKLRLKLESESQEGRAGELRGRILKEERIVVILDDIWSELDLAEVGVPFGDDHKGCKLVMTSRSLDVLQNKMGTQENVALQVLTEPESLDLFEKTAGYVVKLPDIDPIARDVVKCCAGLPLLIVIVAKALKRKQNVAVWNDFLNKLKTKTGKPIDDVIKKMRPSYDFLESEEHRSLLLLIGSVGEYGTRLRNNHQLFAMCWGLRIYENVRTLEQARNRHHTLIEGLRDSSLLLEDGADTWLSMHDLVREMARSVASDEHSTLLVEKLSGINEWLMEGRLQNYDRIILRDYDISELPDEKLECLELKLLLIDSTSNKKLTVPENFFSGMTKVNVLHLRGMKYFDKFLPLSLCLLTELTSLNLSKCKLKDIKIIGELKSLEILILEEVRKLVEIPKEVGNLTHLRMLNVSYCPELEFITKNLFSSSKYLEELYLLSYYEHRPLVSAIESNCASLGDKGNLHLLTTLELDVEINNALNFPLNFAELKRYKIFIGCRPPPLIDTSKFSKVLAVKDSPDSQRSMFNDNGVQLLLKTVECLYLNNLKLSSLMVNMEEICGALPPFGMLKLIKVEDCSKMKNLFWSSQARHLSQLQEMEVSGCDSITEIIAREKQGTEKQVIQLPKLRSLSLICLPELHSFCSMSNNPRALFDKVILPNLLISHLDNLNSLCHIQLALGSFSWLSKVKISKCPKFLNAFPSFVLNHLHNLVTLNVSDCDELQVVFEIQDQEQSTVSSHQQQVLATRLEALNLDLLPKLKRIWSKDPHGTLRFQNLCTVHVQECRSLDHVFPISVAEDLQHLQKLHIYNCCGIQSIVEKGDSDGINKHVYLENLFLSRCHRLKNIFQSSMVFHNLSELHVYKCHGVINIMTSSMATSLSELRVLKISFCDSIEEVVASGENEGDSTMSDEIGFMKLVELELECLCRLKSFCGGNYSFMFPSLQIVRVFECPMMKTFCNGNLTAARLKMLTTFRVPTSEEEHRWDGDLNTTIGNIFAEKSLCILSQLLLQELLERN